MSLTPILYSFRRCPYAIRARLALAFAKVKVELREVRLSDKPPSMLAISPKATVPVLQLPGGEVIDESIDIISWAHQHMDKSQVMLWQPEHELVSINDQQFKYYLDRYKYFERYPEKTQQAYRAHCHAFLAQLEASLLNHPFLLGAEPSLVDVAIMPFIRQFAKVDLQWFYNAPYPNLNNWLKHWLQQPIFEAVMKKFKPWQLNDPAQYT